MLANDTARRVTNIELALDEVDIRGMIYCLKKISQSFELKVSQLPDVPVGTIIAWTLKIDIDGSEYIDRLPDGWVRCDGKPIPSNSVWVGRPTPNLNGEKRFLRGGLDTEVLIMEDHMMHEHAHSALVDDSGHAHGYCNFL